MPSFNTAIYISEAINGVINQTYKNWELIIVDDCSTDDTIEIINNFNDERIILLINQSNCGAAISRNRALNKASGQWVAFIDSDDIWCSDKLEKQIKFMQENDYNFSYTMYEHIDEASKPLNIIVSGPKRITSIDMYNYCWPGCLTVMYNQEYVGKINIADIKKNNDYALWLKVCKKADCFLLEENLAKYRIRSGSISNHSYFKLIKWHYKMFREADGCNNYEATALTIRNILFGIWKKIKYINKK
jgi:glycosyltransferase involved in cell wall biosynthesis